MLPAVHLDGKIILESPGKLALSPNGNGALFDSIAKDESLQEEISKLEYIQIIGVDNILNKVLDPVFIGLNI